MTYVKLICTGMAKLDCFVALLFELCFNMAVAYFFAARKHMAYLVCHLLKDLKVPGSNPDKD